MDFFFAFFFASKRGGLFFYILIIFILHCFASVLLPFIAAVHGQVRVTCTIFTGRGGGCKFIFFASHVLHSQLARPPPPRLCVCFVLVCVDVSVCACLRARTHACACVGTRVRTCLYLCTWVCA